MNNISWGSLEIIFLSEQMLEPRNCLWAHVHCIRIGQRNQFIYHMYFCITWGQRRPYGGDESMFNLSRPPCGVCLPKKVISDSVLSTFHVFEVCLYLTYVLFVFLLVRNNRLRLTQDVGNRLRGDLGQMHGLHSSSVGESHPPRVRVTVYLVK